MQTKGLFLSRRGKARRFLRVAFLLVLGTLGYGLGQCEPEAEASDQTVLELALEKLELGANDFAPDPFRILSSRGAARHSPFFRRLISQPLGAPYRVGVWESQFRQRSDSVHRMMLYTSSLIGADIVRGYFGNPLAALDAELVRSSDPLAFALEKLADASGDPDFRPTLPPTDELPEPLRFEVARVICAISSAEQFRQRALRNMPEGLDEWQLMEQVLSNKSPGFDLPDWRLAAEDVELEALFAGMFDLIIAYEDFNDYLSTADEVAQVHWSLETPLGLIMINTLDQSDEYILTDAPLLAVDTAGDDLWTITGYSADQNISLVMDSQGDDTYESGEFPGFGVGVLGYGVLVDESGDDVYRGDLLNTGASVFGASLVVDRLGDDRYESGAYSQAYAIVGSSLLVDLEGDDKYTSIVYSQASAESMGSAVLFDDGGNDEYLLSNEPLIRPSAQSAAHNASMGQGTAAGFRASMIDGRSLAGGVAVLMDSSGDDKYTGSVFCQGSGYLESVGLLIDGDGADEYRGVWYAQGAAAHSAFGGLLDRGGEDDVYFVQLATSIGTAHDFSGAFLYDEGGNDNYEAEGLAIGAANQNSTALFVDESGDDRYNIRAKGVGLGAGKQRQWGTMREVQPNVGFFFDLGGADRYEIPPRDKGNYSANIPAREPGDDGIWTYTHEYPDLDLPSERGIGIDGEYETPFNIRPRTQADDYDLKMLNNTLEERRRYRASREEFLAEQAPAEDQ